MEEPGGEGGRGWWNWQELYMVLKIIEYCTFLKINFLYRRASEDVKIRGTLLYGCGDNLVAVFFSLWFARVQFMDAYCNHCVLKIFLFKKKL